jgi:predicted PurR-regulated permease PerM
MIEKIIKSHLVKESEYNNHLERFLTFLNIFFRIGEFNTIENTNVYRLIQTSLNDVEKAFKDFKGNKIIEESKNKILKFLKEQKSSFKKLMKNNDKDVNKIIEFLDNKLKTEMITFKRLLVDELNNLEKKIGDELNKIGSEMISISKDIANPFSTKEKLLVGISFCTLGVGVVIYGLFYKLPNLIINAISEERKFQQFLEEIEEKIVKEFQNIKDSIDNNIKSFKKIVTKNIKSLDGVIKVDNIKNDEYWKNAKEKYLIIYNEFKTFEKSKNLFD